MLRERSVRLDLQPYDLADHMFAPSRGEDTRRDLGKRLNSVAEDIQRKAQEVARHLRGRLNQESRSSSDNSTELPPKKDQARETARTVTSSTERTIQG